MSSPKLIIQDIDKKVNKSVPINITSKSVPLDSELSLTPPKVQTSLYKTERCRSWISTGMCKYGNKCQFAHGEDELRPVMRHPKYKTQICKTFSRDGFCPYSSRCRFIHPGEIDSKNDTEDYEYEGNSLPDESPSLIGRMSPISQNMANSIFGERGANGTDNGFGGNQEPAIFSSSLPNFNTNWLTDMKDHKKNVSNNNGTNNNNNGGSNNSNNHPLWNPSPNISPTKSNAKNIHLSDTLHLTFDSVEDYDPFNLKESPSSHSSHLHQSPSTRKSDLFSPRNNFFHPSSPISQFHFSPSPISNSFFNLSNPTITSPNNNNNNNNNSSSNLGFHLDESNPSITLSLKKDKENDENDLVSGKKRTKSIPGELFNLKDNSPIVRSKPTTIPNGTTSSLNMHSNNNNNNNNNSSGNSSPSDSKARLPIFASLAN